MAILYCSFHTLERFAMVFSAFLWAYLVVSSDIRLQCVPPFYSDSISGP